MVYRWTMPDGELAEVTDGYTVAPMTPDGVRSLLLETGFAIEGWYGNYDRSSYDPTRHDQLIVTARPDKSRGFGMN